MGTGLSILATIGIAFLTSLITSIWAPWNTLRIDNARQLRKSRKEKVARWREFIASQEFQDMNEGDFLQNATYLELRPYLNDRTRRFIEPSFAPVKTLNIYSAGKAVHWLAIQRKLLERVDELEAEWDL